MEELRVFHSPHRNDHSKKQVDSQLKLIFYFIYFLGGCCFSEAAIIVIGLPFPFI